MGYDFDGEEGNYGGEKEERDRKREGAKIRSYMRSDCLLTYLNV